MKSEVGGKTGIGMKCVVSDYQVKTVFITAHRPAHLYFDKDKNGGFIKFYSALDVVENPAIVF